MLTLRIDPAVPTTDRQAREALDAKRTALLDSTPTVQFLTNVYTTHNVARPHRHRFDGDGFCRCGESL